MHSAKKLFEEKGMGNVTIEEITEAADVSRSTFFAHFSTLDALSAEICGVAIEDILNAHAKSGKTGIEGIIALFNKLIDDTCPYPYLTAELLMNGIIKSRGESPFLGFQELIVNELSKGGNKYDYTPDELASFITGAYFGTVFNKLINKQPFNPDEIKKSMKKYILNITGGIL